MFRPKSIITVITLFAWLTSGLAVAATESEVTSDQGAQVQVAAVKNVPDETCLMCHGDKSLGAATERGESLDLYVAEDSLKGTPHEGFSCTDCHIGAKTFEDIPHNDGKPLDLKCAQCHSGVIKEYKESVHGRFLKEGDRESAFCGDCHGKHNIFPASDRRSTVNKFNLPKTCAQCHEGGAMLKTHKVGDPEAARHFIDSIHGRALLVNGLNVAPSCNDCHGDHDILPSEDENSPIHKSKVSKTCGKCHTLVEEVYNESIHGKLFLEGDPRGPSCVSCHTSHEIVSAVKPEFRLSIDNKCGQCHEEPLEHYRETFHGKAIALGRAGVATCSDCHGNHNILPQEDPNSLIHEGENRLETCQQCHPDAEINFTGYIIHADHTDSENYPILYWTFVFMTLLLLGTFAFFALHTILWFTRSAVLFLRDPRTFVHHKVKSHKVEEGYVRFQPLDRFLHGLIIFSFLLLVVTGMPLKFYYTDWAKWILDIMGGQAVAAIMHRLGAIITIFYFSVHILSMIYRSWKGRAMFKDPAKGRVTIRQIIAVALGPDSPIPSLQDLKDFIAHQKWFFGRGPKPQFDRWTYWEKFDYMAVFWGVAMIGLSGLIMWYPEFFTGFLPGWIINVALIIHSDEALLAAGFIFTFHFFNVHFRPERFPMDHAIFSGRVSHAEMLHERKKLFDRWKKDGTLESRKAKDEWPSWRWIAMPAGFLAFLIGVVMVILIYMAMYTRLVKG